jgi:6-pyruvoyltetrahydropterin/6-carboxytetrahydropterin synthase
MFTISKEFTFEAAHHLEGLPTDHPCTRPHGHSYTVIVTLRAERLNSVGFVRDYRSLDIIKTWIDRTLDHQDLNEVFSFNPTAENLAQHLFNEFSHFGEMTAVTVKETAKTSATYERD